MLFRSFAAVHNWYPKMFGVMYNEKFGNVGWFFMFAGFNILYFPMFLLGIQGMPRRYFDYLPEYSAGQMLSSIGAAVLIFGIILMVSNLLISLKRGKPAEANPWGGITLEWTIPSPPPLLNFDEEVEIKHGPYDYE